MTSGLGESLQLNQMCWPQPNWQGLYNIKVPLFFTHLYCCSFLSGVLWCVSSKTFRNHKLYQGQFKPHVFLARLWPFFFALLMQFSLFFSPKRKHYCKPISPCVIKFDTLIYPLQSRPYCLWIPKCNRLHLFVLYGANILSNFELFIEVLKHTITFQLSALLSVTAR